MSEPYTVTLTHNDARFEVNPGETILQAAIRHGIELPHGCRTGVCGVCISRIISGAIEYPDGEPLSLFEEDIAANRGLCCVGHPSDDLILDIINQGENFEPWESD